MGKKYFHYLTGCFMGAHNNRTLKKYKSILEERYKILIQELDGTPHSMPRDGYPGSAEEYKKSHSWVNSLDLRLAADDFINALKEVKKLK